MQRYFELSSDMMGNHQSTLSSTGNAIDAAQFWIGLTATLFHEPLNSSTACGKGWLTGTLRDVAAWRYDQLASSMVEFNKLPDRSEIAEGTLSP